MQIRDREIHIWPIQLSLSETDASQRWSLLSLDEQQRAEHFHFPLHKKRFIVARSTLRRILSFYFPCLPHEIDFAYTAYKKPYLAFPLETGLQFNLSHSHDLALLAITQHHAVGIDIEKIHPIRYQVLAKRYFSTKEYDTLMSLAPTDQLIGFYQLWARKEALIKAVGKGLTLSLSSFSVSLDDRYEQVLLEQQQWSLISLSVHPDYQSALASNQLVNRIQYWNLHDESYEPGNVLHLPPHQDSH